MDTSLLQPKDICAAAGADDDDKTTPGGDDANFCVFRDQFAKLVPRIERVVPTTHRIARSTADMADPGPASGRGADGPKPVELGAAAAVSRREPRSYAGPPLGAATQETDAIESLQGGLDDETALSL